jgi:hypothetical protein
MKSYFKIYQTCTSDIVRPPISYKIREYFEKFLSDNVLEKKKIIIGGKWTIYLSMLFVEEGARYTLKEVYMAKGSRTISAEAVKLYEILIPLKCIQEAKNPLLETIELMYEAIKIFITTTYKKVTPELMDELWKEVDLEYLLSLPYPAPLAEQKYVGDKVKPDGTIELLQLK